MVMDGGSVVAQQATSVMTSGGQQQQQQQQQQQPAPQGQQQGQSSQTGTVGVQQESAPNATRVAREFVRQYYTILHESPGLLHRFYNDESDFIHGSLDSSCDPGAVTGVRGQQEIHRTILALNFHECYARIAYVDAQESTNKSVVVQVAGELSNRGSPMRRFLQTFVLVPLSARKYYVRNDIFRYQDEIYTEDTADEDDLNANEAVTTPPTAVNQHHAATLPNGGGDLGHHPTPGNGVALSSTGPSTEKQIYHSNQSSPEQTSRKDEPRDDSVSNNNSNTQWDGANNQGQQQSPQAAQTKQSQQQTAAQGAQPSAGGVANVSETSVPSSAQGSETASAVPSATAPTTGTTQRSWSQMVQVKPAADPTLTTTVQHQQTSFGPPAANANNSQQSTFGGSPAQSTAVAGGGGQPQRVQRGSAPGGPRVNGMGGNMSKKDTGSASPREENAAPLSIPGGGNDMKNTYNIPDSHQLFVGNIPPSATEQDLLDLFKSNENVIGFRLQNSKNNTSGGLPGTKAAPNFGFVLFDSAEPVQTWLRDGPRTVELTLPNNVTAKLNVEEKKARVGGKGPRGSGPSRGRLSLSNGGGGSGGGRREYSAGGDRRPPRSAMGNRAQIAGGHDGHGGSSQH